MCDELVNAIKETPELIELHQNRMSDTMWANDDNHILAYDIIYSGIVYNLYNNITIIKPTKSKAQTHEQQKQQKREEFTAMLEQVNSELNTMLQERITFDEFSAKGLIVTHKTFGEGVVIAHSGNLISIKFGEQEKRFQMPQGFSNGFLKTESVEIMDMFNEMARLDDAIAHLKSQQSSVQRQLSLL